MPTFEPMGAIIMTTFQPMGAIIMSTFGNLGVKIAPTFSDYTTILKVYPILENFYGKYGPTSLKKTIIYE